MLGFPPKPWFQYEKLEKYINYTTLVEIDSDHPTYMPHYGMPQYNSQKTPAPPPRWAKSAIGTCCTLCVYVCVVCVCVCVCLVLRLPKDMGNDNVRVHLQMRCHACEEIAMANYICIIVCVHRPHNTDQRKQKQRQLENTSQLIAAWRRWVAPAQDCDGTSSPFAQFPTEKPQSIRPAVIKHSHLSRIPWCKHCSGMYTLSAIKNRCCCAAILVARLALLVPPHIYIYIYRYMPQPF